MAREATWTDDEGRHWATLIPDNAPDDHAPMGIAVGPEPLDALGLPHDFAVRLHNQLFERRIFGYTEAARRPNDIAQAVRAAVKVDAHSIIDLYRERAILAPED